MVLSSPFVRCRRPLPGAIAIAIALLDLAGCNFDADGLHASDSGRFPDTGGSGSSSAGSSSAGTTTTAQSTGLGDGSGGAETGDDTTGSPPDSSGGPDGPAHLVFADGSKFEYGNVNLGGGGSSHTFTLTNDGGQTATAINPAPMLPAFTFDGGPYPGVGGTCTGALDPGASCTLLVRFDPLALGPVDDQLHLDYNEGGAATSVMIAVLGAGAGSTVNLLQNGDAEQGGDPPMHWTEFPGTNGTSSTGAHGGSYSLQAEGTVAAELRQDVSVATWGSAIDAGGFRFEIDGFTSVSSLADQRWIRVEFYAGNTRLSYYETDTPLDTAWTEVQHGEAAPMGTRTVRVRLMCATVGTCSARYDDLVLRGVYP